MYIQRREVDMDDEGPVEVDARSWERLVEKGERPVIVMFYGPACQFCRVMEPYFRKYAGEYRESVLFARLNIEANQWIAERYGVRSTPTFKFFCSGRPVAEMVGAVYPALLKRLVDEGIRNGKDCVRSSTGIDYEITGYG